MGRLTPPYIGGRGRLTCRVLVGYKLVSSLYYKLNSNLGPTLSLVAFRAFQVRWTPSCTGTLVLDSFGRVPSPWVGSYHLAGSVFRSGLVIRPALSPGRVLSSDQLYLQAGF